MTEAPARPDPMQDADAEARAQARGLLQRATFAALSYTDAETKTPAISRIAFGLDPAGRPLTFISALAQHHAGLRAFADCALMVADDVGKGDPLTHPRLMLRARAEFVAQPDPMLRAHWLKGHPKAALYIDFADFCFVRFLPISAVLNAGFARAYRLGAADLA